LLSPWQEDDNVKNATRKLIRFCFTILSDLIRR